jgi:hypothetical protein
MKKITTKLQFKQSTIRVLQDSELETIQGGSDGIAPRAPTANCSQQQTGCGSGGGGGWGHGHTKHC